MNPSRRKPTSCSVVPGSSLFGPSHYAKLLHFSSFLSLSSFFFLPRFSSSFPFFFSTCFCLSFFFSLLFWFPLLSPCTPSLPFPFSLFPFFSLFFYFLHRILFPLNLVWDQVVVTHALMCHPLTLSPMHEAMWSYTWPSCHGRRAMWHYATCHHAIRLPWTFAICTVTVVYRIKEKNFKFTRVFTFSPTKKNFVLEIYTHIHSSLMHMQQSFYH